MVRRWLGLCALAMLFAMGAAAAAGTSARKLPAWTTAPDSAAGPESAAFDSTVGDSFAAPRLFLSWSRTGPGAPGDVEISCRDTSRVDTLFLSFETGRDVPRFQRMYGRLFFRPAPNDTLGDFWDFAHNGENHGNLRIQFDPEPSFPCAQPWVRQGHGGVTYEFDRSAAWLEMAFAVRAEGAVPVSGRTRYCFARVMIDERWCGRLSGSHQPVCLEWEQARYSGGGPLVTIAGGPGRFASANSPDGRACATYRTGRRPKVWNQRPGVPIQPVRRPPEPDTTGH